MFNSTNSARRSVQYKIMQEINQPWHMGTYLLVFGKRFPMNTNMTGFRYCQEVSSLQNDAKELKNDLTMAYGYSYVSTWQKLYR